MRATFLLSTLGVAAGLAAQNVATFPGDYVNVPDGPYWSESLPYAWGISRVMSIYDAWDIGVPNGSRITRVGFRQDGQVAQVDVGKLLQLEVRMGYATNPAHLASAVFDQNYAATPTTVFGPTVFTLPNLRDPNNPLPNGIAWLALTTPFTYTPASGNLVVEFRINGNNAGGAAFPYYLDRAWVYSPTGTGPAGCPHTGNLTPTLASDGAAVGYQFGIALHQAPANSMVALLLTPGGRLLPPYNLQPYLPGIAAACTGQLSLANVGAVLGFSDPSGNLGFYFTVPGVLRPFNDMWVGAQAACFDFFAPGGLAVSNGAEVQIGVVPSCNQVFAQGLPANQTQGALYYGYCPVTFFDYQ